MNSVKNEHIALYTAFVALSVLSLAIGLWESIENHKMRKMQKQQIQAEMKLHELRMHKENQRNV